LLCFNSAEIKNSEIGHSPLMMLSEIF